MRIIIVLQIHSRIYDAKDVFFYRLFEISNGILFESKTKQLILRINSWLLLIGKLMIITTWLWKIRLLLSIDIFNNYKNQKLLQKSIQSENNDKLHCTVLFFIPALCCNPFESYFLTTWDFFFNRLSYTSSHRSLFNLWHWNPIKRTWTIMIFSRNLIILDCNDHMWSYQIKCASFSRKSMT